MNTKLTQFACLVAVLCFNLAAGDLHAETRRALLIGINTYRLNILEREKILQAEAAAGKHRDDSRFGGHAEWPNLHGALNDVESMRLLLTQYDFTDITLCVEKQATREGILRAIDDLTAKTQPGDTVVFYFSGHGSLRLNTTKYAKADQLDETIVPSDAYEGAYDIRDKELAQRFNRILDDRKGRLIAIFDSCHSGTQARGITGGISRNLPFDDRDVAQDPAAYTGANLKHVPQDGNTIIMTASMANESAQETQYPDDNLWHGSFTRALVNVLRNADANWRAVDVINSVHNLMRTDGLAPQQPTAEGRVEQSLFGGPVTRHLRASVVKADKGEAELNVGSIAGFDAASEFTSVKTSANAAGANPVVVQITKVVDATKSLAKITSGQAAIEPGTLLELTKLVVPPEVKLRVFIPSADWDPAKSPPAEARKKFAGFEWKNDPSLDAVQYWVTWSQGAWQAIDQNGRKVTPAEATALAGHGKLRSAFLALPPAATLLPTLRKLPGFENGVIELVQEAQGSQYLLAGREADSGLQYTFFRSDIMAAHPAGNFIESRGIPDDPNSKVVCAHDGSMPVRTEWVMVSVQLAGTVDVHAAEDLQQIAARLSKQRTWIRLGTDSQPPGHWPYRLAAIQRSGGADRELTPDTVLQAGNEYRLALIANRDQIAAAPVNPMFVYLVGCDCSGRSFLLYPPSNSNGGSALPQAKTNGTYPDQMILFNSAASEPLGTDTVIMLVTPEKITDLSVFQFDGVLAAEQAARGLTNGFGELIRSLGAVNMLGYGTRGFGETADHWSVQQLVIRSEPGKK